MLKYSNQVGALNPQILRYDHKFEDNKILIQKYRTR